MARFKNHLLVVIGFAVAGMIGAACGTGTAQAVVSTLVSVVNPNTSPVQTSSVDVTDPGRIAYQSTIDNVGMCSATFCNFIFPFVPTGHRVVIQHISGQVFFAGTPPAPGTILAVSGGGVNAGFFLPLVGLDLVYFDQSVLFYVDSGNQLTLLIEAFNGALFNISAPHQTVTLTGYELDCTVAACAPIATQ
jgi:hypothetical protein